MKLFIPQFVFEIRFNHILNFKDVYREKLSQYVKLAERFTIGQQNIVEENIIFQFPSENYKIIAQWDRLSFQYEGDFAKLNTRHSAIEIPFFKIYKEIQTIESFTSTKQHTILQVTVVNTDVGEKNNVERIKGKYFTKDIEDVLPDSNDVAIVLEKKNKEKEINITYGPYKGIQDLKNRNMFPSDVDNIPDSEYGEMAIIKVVEHIPNVNFGVFSEQCDLADDLISRVWQQ